MEGFGIDANSSDPKLKVFNSNVTPIDIQRDDHQRSLGRGRYLRQSKSPSFDPYASTDQSNLENLGSTFIRYLRSRSQSTATGDPFKTPTAYAANYCSGIGQEYLSRNSNYHGNSNSNYIGNTNSNYIGNSNSNSSGFGSGDLFLRLPLSAIENLETPPSRSPPVYGASVKVEEDVVVMDGILVGSVLGSRLRYSSSDSGGSSSSGGKNHYKKEICQLWEDSNSCHYGSKCQFAHGKEELRPTRLSNKTKSMTQTCKSFFSYGSCAYGAKCRFFHHQVTTGTLPAEPATALDAGNTTQTISSMDPESANTSSFTLTGTDWSPQDDGINVTLPTSAAATTATSREEIDAYIQSVLQGPSQRTRLPVLAEICSGVASQIKDI